MWRLPSWVCQRRSEGLQSYKRNSRRGMRRVHTRGLAVVCESRGLRGVRQVLHGFTKVQEHHILPRRGVQPLRHYVQEHEVWKRGIGEKFKRRSIKQRGMRRDTRRKVAVEETGFRRRGVQEVML